MGIKIGEENSYKILANSSRQDALQCNSTITSRMLPRSAATSVSHDDVTSSSTPLHASAHGGYAGSVRRRRPSLVHRIRTCQSTPTSPSIHLHQRKQPSQVVPYSEGASSLSSPSATGGKRSSSRATGLKTRRKQRVRTTTLS